MSKKENSSVGRIIRERMGFVSSKGSQASDSPRGIYDFERDVSDNQEANPAQNLKKKKSVKIADGKENMERGNDVKFAPSGKAAPHSILANSRSPSRGRSLSKRAESPVTYDSPR